MSESPLPILGCGNTVCIRRRADVFLKGMRHNTQSEYVEQFSYVLSIDVTVAKIDNRVIGCW